MPEAEWVAVGLRIAQARAAVGWTQEALAARAGVDRTALAKSEKGRRAVPALELARIATALGRPMDWFVSGPAAEVVSRRASSSNETLLDVEVDRAVRDVKVLLDLGLLTPRPGRVPAALRNFEQATELARRIRNELDLTDGPVIGLAAAIEPLGLHTIGAAVGTEGDEGVYSAVDGTGVAVINSSMAPGRRRFTLAHELGHHLLADAFASHPDVIGEGANRERMINAFAADFLMPREGVHRRWELLRGPSDPRAAAIVLAVEYRVSWTAVCGFLNTLGLITRSAMARLRSQRPSPAELAERGLEIVEEIPPGYVSPLFASAVVRGFRGRHLGRARTLQLLRGSLEEADLPELPPTPDGGL